MKAKVVPEDFENEKHLYNKKVINQEQERLKNHIFIRCNSIVRKVVAFAIDLILNKKFPNVKLSAVGKNMDKLIFITELIKRKVKGLAQQTSLDILNYKEVYVPKTRKEGLTEVVISRQATLLNVILDYRDTIEPTHYGYQRPLPLGLVSQKNPRDYVLMVINEFKKKNKKGKGGKATRGEGKKKKRHGGNRGDNRRNRGWGDNDDQRRGGRRDNRRRDNGGRRNNTGRDGKNRKNDRNRRNRGWN